MKVGHILWKTAKIILITLGSLILLVVILLAAAKLSENKIVGLVLNKVSVELKAPFSVREVNLLPLRNFPNLTVELQDFSVGKSTDSLQSGQSSNPFDTLFSLHKLYVAVKAKPLLSSKVVVDQVEIDGATLNYHVDSTGASNFDFLMTTTDTTQVPEDTSQVETVLNILLHDLTLSNIVLNYADDSLRAKACVAIPEIKLNGKVMGSYYAGAVEGSISVSDLALEGTHADRMGKTSLDFKVGYDNGDISVDKLNLNADGFGLSANGKAKLSDSIFVDMGVGLTNMDFGRLTAYLPDTLLSSYGLTALGGIFDLKAHIKGFVYDTLLLPSVEASLDFRNGFIKTTSYPTVETLAFNGKVKLPDPNNLKTASADFSTFRVKTHASNLNLAFKILNIEKPIYNVKGDMFITLDEFGSFIPDSLVKSLSGNIIARIETRGQLPDSLGMSSADYFMQNTTLNVKLRNITAVLDSSTSVRGVNLNFDFLPGKQVAVENFTADLSIPGYHVGLDNFLLRARLIGDIANTSKFGVDVDSLLIKVGNSSLGGRFKVMNLDKPTYSAKSFLNVNFNELRPFIPDTLVETLTGRMAATVQSHGTLNLDSLSSQIMPIAFEQSRFTLNLDSLNFAMPNDTLMRVDNLSLKLAMSDDTIRINGFHGQAMGIEFAIDSTRIWNVYKAMLKGEKDKKLVADTRIQLSDIDFAMFAPFMATDSTAAEPTPQPAEPQEKVAGSEAPATESSFTIPSYIIRGTVAVNSFKYGNMLIDKISTKFRVDDSLYVIDDLKLNAFGGDLTLSALYDTRNDTATVIEAKCNLNRMNIRQLLADNNDFDQTFFTHENIEGLATGELFARVIMRDTNILYDKISLLGNFKLENGGIYNFEPLMQLSKFTNLNELERVVFRTLETSVFVYNNEIYFPKTDIVSSAMDISVYGMQSFADDYEYHLIVHLGDVLVGKSNKLLKQQGMESDVFEGQDKANRSGLYLVALNRGKDSKYGFDTQHLQRLMKTTIRVQERGLNLIFNPKVVNFSTEIDRRERKKKPNEAKG